MRCSLGSKLHVLTKFQMCRGCANKKLDMGLTLITEYAGTFTVSRIQCLSFALDELE